MTGDPPSSAPEKNRPEHDPSNAKDAPSSIRREAASVLDLSQEYSAQSSDLAQKARHGAFWMGTMSTLAQIVSWAITILCARILQPGDYGVMALADTFLPYLAIIATLSIGLWIVQESQLTEHELECSAFLAVILAGVVSLITFAAAPAIAGFYEDPSLAFPFQLLALVPFIRSLSLPSDSWLRRELRYKELSFLMAVISFARGIVQLILAYLGYGFWSLVIGLLVSEVALSVLTIRAGKKGFRWRKDFVVWRRILKWGIPASLSAVCWIVYASADNIVVGKLFGKEALGFYAMAFYLSSLPISKFNTMFRSVIFSYFSRLKESPREFQSAVLRLNRNLCLLIFPAVVGLAAVSEDFVLLVFGEKWIPMIVPLKFLSLSAVLRVSVDNLTSFVSAAGDSAQAFRIQLAGVAILPVSFLVGANLFGLPGIYGVWIVIFPVVVYIMVCLARDTIGVSPTKFFWDLRSPAVSSAVMFAAVALFRTVLPEDFGTSVRLGLQIAVGASVYLLTLFVLFREAWSGLKSLLIRSPESL